ncbi:MAG: DUF87 domain-containing protein [Patescibacteria group bacterium]
MSPLFLILYLLVLTVIVIAAFFIVGAWRSRGGIARGLAMTLLLITLPKGGGVQEAASQKTEKDLIGVMEQLLNSLTSLHADGWNKFIYGEPYVALEMGVHHIGEEIHFYAAVPRTYALVFEKQVHGLYPEAQVERAKEYNVFNPGGVTAGAYLKLTGSEIMPFKTYTQLESDPLGQIVTALSKLQREGEGAALQVLIRPSHRKDIAGLAQKVAQEMQRGNPFQKALTLAKRGKPAVSKNTPAIQEPPQVVTPFESEIVKLLQSKASRPLFETNIRLLVSAADETRAEQLFQEVTGAFSQFSLPDLNNFKIFRLRDRALETLAFRFSFRLFDKSQTVFLSSEEVASLYHFPLPTTQAPRIKSLKSRAAEPPANLPEQGVLLGINRFRGQEHPVRLTDDDRRRHLYIIGQTGTGKSSLMKQMIAQDLRAGKGLCMIDPHGELAEYTLSQVPRERGDDVVYFNPGDVERPMGLNMFEIDPSHPEQKTTVINELFGIIEKLYDLKVSGGPMFEKYFKNACLLLLDDYAHDVPVLADISRVLVNDKYRADKLTRETNPLVREFWQLEAEKAGGDASLANMAPYVSSKIDTFVSNEFLRPIINQKKSVFNFREVIDNQKILVVNLSKGRIGDINANLLGMIISGKLLMAALSRVDVPEDQRKDFSIYMDEFHNFTTDSIATILSEARKYRLSLVMAHQFMKQLKDTIRDAVVGNVGSMVAFRVGADDAEFLKNQFAPIFTAQDLLNIDNFNAHMKLLINNQTSRPFTIQTVQEEPGDGPWAAWLKDASRIRYGRSRQEVEQEIQMGYKEINPKP